MTTLHQALETSRRPTGRTPYTFQRHDDLVDAPVAGGERDHWAISSILDLCPTLPNGIAATDDHGRRGRQISGCRTILEWLRSHPGGGWQERWIVSGADRGLDWVDTFVARDPRSPKTARHELILGLTSLLLGRIVRPSYQFLNDYHATGRYVIVRQVFRPDLFARLEARGDELNIRGSSLGAALRVVSKMVLHTGREVDQLTAEDVFAFRAWNQRHYKEHGRSGHGLAMAWSLLRDVADLGEHATLHDAVRYGQRPTAELVDAYRLQCQPVRDVLGRVSGRDQ